MPPIKTWEVAQALFGSAELDSLLAAGWEPFAAFFNGNQTVVVLRREA
jgi:hypothetical protein